MCPPPPPQSPLPSPRDANEPLLHFPKSVVRKPPPPPISPPQSPVASSARLSFSAELAPGKNTFVHYDLPVSPFGEQGPPAKTAPGSLLGGFLQPRLPDSPKAFFSAKSYFSERIPTPTGPPLVSFSSIFFGDEPLGQAAHLMDVTDIDTAPALSAKHTDISVLAGVTFDEGNWSDTSVSVISNTSEHTHRPPMMSYSIIFFGDASHNDTAHASNNTDLDDVNDGTSTRSCSGMESEVDCSFEDSTAPPLASLSALYFGEAVGEDPTVLQHQIVPAKTMLAEAQRSPATSQGSVLHSSGRCSPCAWFWKAKGCENGEACTRCHLCPEGETKARKKMKKKQCRLNGESEVDDLLGMGMANTAELRVRMPTRAEQTMIFAPPLPVHTAVLLPFVTLDVHLDRNCITPLSNEDASASFVSGRTQEIDSAVGSSMGGTASLAHLRGECKPCAYFMYKIDGCRQGDDCEFCHSCGKGELKKRRKERRKGSQPEEFRHISSRVFH